MKRSVLAAMAGLALGATGVAAQTAPARAVPTGEYAYGADISSVTELEARGLFYRDRRGARIDLFDLVKEHGINAIRLRVWVNPKGGWSGMEDVLAKAKRARAHGQAIMIDFHYSDDWADPGKQPKPAAWASYDVPALTAAVAAHTRDTLALLTSNGIDVAWVQVGNEITNGMLWPEGHTDRFATLARMTNAGYDAVKAVYPDAQVVIHIDNGWDTAKARWWFDNFAANKGKVDVIGLSYYPFFTPSKDWHVESPKVSATMAELAKTYGKPVMIVEAGYQYDKPTDAKAMLVDLIARNRALGSLGTGVFYWEPGTMPAASGYKLGATDRRNRFTRAMEAFRH